MERNISATDGRIHFGELMGPCEGEGEAADRGAGPHVVVISMGEYQCLKAAEEGREEVEPLTH